MDISYYLASNIPLLSICLVVIFISIRNIKVRTRQSIYFLSFTVIVLLLATVVFMEKYASTYGLVVVGTIFTSIGYIFRPILLFIFILLANMDEKRSKWFYIVSSSLLAVNIVIYMLPLFFGVEGPSTAVFYYTLEADGTALFHRGDHMVLNFTSHIISFIYLVVLSVLSMLRFKGKHRRDALVLFLCVIIITSTVITEVLTARSDLLNIIAGICILIDYIFIVSINSSRDPLTHLYDRRTYYEDISKYKNIINGVIQIDMNELKYFNDNFGHEAGDEALLTIANVLESSIVPATMCAYRLSGDEFLVVMFQGKKEQLESTVDRIKLKMSESKYSIALGYYFVEKGNQITFDELMKKAEGYMYDDKAEYYVKSGHDRRGRK